MLPRKVAPDGKVGDKALAPQTLNLILKAAARRLWGGEAARRVSGDSLRAGYCTEAAKQGISLHLIRRQTGHTSIDALMRYIRGSDLGPSIL